MTPVGSTHVDVTRIVGHRELAAREARSPPRQGTGKCGCGQEVGGPSVAPPISAGQQTPRHAQRGRTLNLGIGRRRRSSLRQPSRNPRRVRMPQLGTGAPPPDASARSPSTIIGRV